MKAKAIVYTSHTGFTARYAKALGEKTGLPVMDLKTAVRDLPHGTPVVFFGWLCAGAVNGFRKAADLFAISAVCPVGMAPQAPQVTDPLEASYPAVFYLRGGYDYRKLTGIYKAMMWAMTQVMVKKAKKPGAVPETQGMAAALKTGGDWVDLTALDPIADYLAD